MQSFGSIRSRYSSGEKWRNKYVYIQTNFRVFNISKIAVGSIRGGGVEEAWPGPVRVYDTRSSLKYLNFFSSKREDYARAGRRVAAKIR